MDIGADELGHQTSTAIVCDRSSLTLGASATCTATVTDTSPGPTPPAGIVTFSTDADANFDAGAECALAAVTGSQSSCQVHYTPNQVGTGVHTLVAGYSGDTSHDPSEGSEIVAVSTAPPGTGTSPKGKGKGGGAGAATPDTRIIKKPKKRTTRRRARFTFTSDQRGSTFECKLDRRRFARCASPFRKKVKLGRHIFRVRAVKGGRADPTPAVYRWKVLSG